jgi:hypothetical protein
LNKLPKALSPGEEQFALLCRVHFHPVNQPEREYCFHLTRRWRFDFAWPDKKIGVEIEGVGRFTFGRHQQKEGYAKDLEKYNAATLAGWRVLRFTTEMVFAGGVIDDVEALLS